MDGRINECLDYSPRWTSVWSPPCLPQFPLLSGERVAEGASRSIPALMSASVTQEPGQLHFSPMSLSLQLSACTLLAPRPLPHYPRCLLSELRGLGELGMSEMLGEVADPLCEPLNWVIREGGASVVLKA